MRKLLVLGIAAVALIAFSGMAAGTVYLQGWQVLNSNGWLYYGELVPGFTFYGKYNYMYHEVWQEFDNTIYCPTHENWHINWDTRSLYHGKPCLNVHYNFMYHVEWTDGYKHETTHYMGKFRIVDPAAADPATQWYLWYPGLTPFIGKYKYPTVEDTTVMMEWMFENIDFTLIPLIDRMEFGGISVDVSIL